MCADDWIDVASGVLPKIGRRVHSLDNWGQISRAERRLIIRGRGGLPLILPAKVYLRRARVIWMGYVDDISMVSGLTVAWRPLGPLEELWLERR